MTQHVVHQKVTLPCTSHLYPFVNLGGERHCDSKVSRPKTQQCPKPGPKPGPLDSESSMLTTKALPPYFLWHKRNWASMFSNIKLDGRCNEAKCTCVTFLPVSFKLRSNLTQQLAACQSTVY